MEAEILGTALIAIVILTFWISCLKRSIAEAEARLDQLIEKSLYTPGKSVEFPTLLIPNGIEFATVAAYRTAVKAAIDQARESTKGGA